MFRRLKGLGKSPIWLIVPLAGSCCCCLVGYTFYIWLLFAQDHQDCTDKFMHYSAEQVGTGVSLSKPKHVTVPDAAQNVELEHVKITKPVSKELTITKPEPQKEETRDIVTTPVNNTISDNSNTAF